MFTYAINTWLNVSKVHITTLTEKKNILKFSYSIKVFSFVMLQIMCVILKYRLYVVFILTGSSKSNKAIDEVTIRLDKWVKNNHYIQLKLFLQLSYLWSFVTSSI